MNKEMVRITLCLAVVTLGAGVILGGVYFWTEPLKKEMQKNREEKTVRTLLHLGSDAKILEVKRYLKETNPPQVAYLLQNRLVIFDLDGTKQSEGSVADAFPDGHYVGRFFIGFNGQGKTEGFVTEASVQGFKSLILFFVALTSDFKIKGVEVLSHEEDPGLGAEIAKPKFKDQFIGKSYQPDVVWKVSKGAQLATKDAATIVAVTGATISSQALVDGVQQAVGHLRHRLHILESEGAFK